MENDGSKPQPHLSVFDRILEEAIQKAKVEALESFVGRLGNQDVISKLITQRVLEWLDSPEGVEKIKAMGLKAIEQMNRPSDRRW